MYYLIDDLRGEVVLDGLLGDVVLDAAHEQSLHRFVNTRLVTLLAGNGAFRLNLSTVELSNIVQFKAFIKVK